MVSTRPKNKTTHPATPVMTPAAKQKVGIKVKLPAKRVMKDQTIQELQARITSLENPHKEPFSKEPLFSKFLKGDSPPVDVEDVPFNKPYIPIEIDFDDDHAHPGQKRCASETLSNPQALKCMKAYSALEDVQPTLQDKPSGLKPDWHYTVSRSSTPGMMDARSSSSSTSVSTIYTQTDSSSTAASPVFSQSPLLNSDHTSSLLAMSPPSQFSKPSHPVFLLDEKPARRQEDTCSITPFCLPHSHRDNNGQRQQPGLKDLPGWLRKDFHNSYIRHIAKHYISLSNTPWRNPTLSLLQQELNHIYPSHWVRLHSDDCAVVPTIHDLGVLWNHIGSKALSATVKYILVQLTKRMLGSKTTRVKYIETIVADPQHPFIWESFRPGTIPLAGERGYYDEKWKGLFQSIPVL